MIELDKRIPFSVSSFFLLLKFKNRFLYDQPVAAGDQQPVRESAELSARIPDSRQEPIAVRLRHCQREEESKVKSEPSRDRTGSASAGAIDWQASDTGKQTETNW